MQQQQQGKQTNNVERSDGNCYGKFRAREKAGLWSKSATKVKESKVKRGKGKLYSLEFRENLNKEDVFVFKIY